MRVHRLSNPLLGELSLARGNEGGNAKGRYLTPIVR